MENNLQQAPTIQQAPVNNYTMPKQPGNAGLKITAVVASILAVCGIGFGIFGMVQGSQKDGGHASDLKIQVKNDDGTTTTIESPEVKTEEGQTTVTIPETAVEDPGDYIYVGAWGLKIKIPDGIASVTYLYDYSQDNSYTKVLVSGAPSDFQYIPDFAKVEKCPLGAIDRFSKQNVELGAVPDFYPEPFMTDDNYNYYYTGPQVVCTEEESNTQYEVNTTNALRAAFTNPSSYSKI